MTTKYFLVTDLIGENKYPFEQFEIGHEISPERFKEIFASDSFIRTITENNTVKIFTKETYSKNVFEKLF